MLIHRFLAITCHTIVAGTILAASLFSSAQFVGNSPQAVEKRVDDLVAKMTLEEKIGLLSGDTPFRTHPIPRLDIPFFQMADGPVGAASPLHGIRRLLCVSASSLDAMRARAARLFSSVPASTSIEPR